MGNGFNIFDAVGFEIIDFDGPVFDTYRERNAPRYFDLGSTAPFDRTNNFVSAEAVRHINAAVRNGIYPIFNTSSLSTTFRGNPLPFTKRWGDPNSDEYQQKKREFEKRGYAAKVRQFESLLSRLAPDVRSKLSVRNNLIVTQPSKGEDKVSTTHDFFSKRGISVDDDLRLRTTIFDDEQGNLDKFAADGFTNTRLTLPYDFEKMPFAKDRGQPWPTLNKDTYEHIVKPGIGLYAPVRVGRKRSHWAPGSGDPMFHTAPIHQPAPLESNPNGHDQWGSYPSILLSPSTIQSLDYAKRNQKNDGHSLDKFKMQIQNLSDTSSDDETAATQFGVKAENRLNTAALAASNAEEFHKLITAEDFVVDYYGSERHIIPEWTKEQVENILPRLSKAQQQRVLGDTIDIDEQTIRLSGMPDYYQFVPGINGSRDRVYITDAKTSGVYGSPKNDTQLRMSYKTQMAMYSYLASLEHPNADIYTGFIHMPVNGDKTSSIQYVPNRVDEKGRALPEDIEANRTYIQSKSKAFFNELKKMSLLNAYAKKNGGKKLEVGTEVFNNKFVTKKKQNAQDVSASDIKELMGETQSLDKSDYIATEDNQSPSLHTESIDDLIEGDKYLNARGMMSPLGEALSYELNGVKQNVSTLISTFNRATQAKLGRNIKYDILKSLYKEDPSGESALWYISEQIGEKYGPYEEERKGKNRRVLKSVSTIWDDFLLSEKVEQEKKAEKKLEQEEKQRRKAAFRVSERNADIGARRRFTVAGRIADLESLPLFDFQKERLADQYARISTKANSEDPTDAMRFQRALTDVNKALQQAERNTKAWTGALSSIANVVNQPWYNGERLADISASGLSQMNSSASGIIPRRLRSVTGHTTAIGQDIARLWWDENYNLKYKAVETARPAYTSLASAAGMVVGGIIGGPLGAMAGGSIGVGLAGIPSAISQWKGNIAERNLKTAIGHADIALNIMSIFGELAKNVLAVPIKLFTNAVKATAGALTAGALLINRYMKQGLDNLQSLGNPIYSLSGVKGYKQYQGLGFADTFLGHQKGTINNSIESFGTAQARLYSMGQLDEDRVVAAAMLGVFGQVYGNNENPEEAYNSMINKLARDMQSGDARKRKQITGIAGIIDPTLPQTLQVMYDMGITDFNKLKQPPGVYWRGINDAERGAMRWTNTQWQATKEMLGITKSRIASTVWNRVGRDFYNGMSRTGDLVSMGHWKDWRDDEDKLHKGAINTAIGTFKDLIENIKDWWDSSELSSAITEMIQKAVNGVKDWVKNLDISELAGTIGAKITSLFGSIDWAAIMEGPIGGAMRAIASIGKYIESTFINVFNILRGMRFDLPKFLLTKGKEGLTFGGKDVDKSLKDVLPGGWLPGHWQGDSYGRATPHGLIDPTDTGTQVATMIAGGHSMISIMRSLESHANDVVGTYYKDGKPMTLKEYLTLLNNQIPGAPKFDPRTESDAYWQSSIASHWNLPTYLGSSLRDIIGTNTPAVQSVNNTAHNSVVQLLDALGLNGDNKDIKSLITGAAKDGIIKIKMTIVDAKGKEQEVRVEESVGLNGEQTLAFRLFSEQLVKGK